MLIASKQKSVMCKGMYSYVYCHTKVTFPSLSCEKCSAILLKIVISDHMNYTSIQMALGSLSTSPLCPFPPDIHFHVPELSSVPTGDLKWLQSLRFIFCF